MDRETHTHKERQSDRLTDIAIYNQRGRNTETDIELTSKI